MTAGERYGDVETRGGGEEGVAAQLLDDLRAARVEVTVAGDKLHYRAPPGALTDDLRAAMQAHKAELLALLEVGTRKNLSTVPTSRENCAVMPEPGADESAPTVPTSGENSPFMREVGAGATLRIPLDDLVYGDFLERNKLRIVGGTAYPDGRHYRPTIYLADDAG